MDEDQIKQLEELGLTRNEAKIYLAMLGRPVFKASEIAQAAGVPRPKVYEGLNNLVNKGFCFPVPGNVAQYSAVSPAEALHDLQRRHEQEFEQELSRRRKMVEGLVEGLKPLHDAGQSETGAMHYIDVLYERNRITQVANDMLASANETLLIFEKQPYAQDPITLNAFELGALMRGVKLRCVFESDHPGLPSRLEPLLANGAEIRILDALPMKLIVADERVAICALRDPITGQQSLTSLRVEHPDFARAMRLLFESIWVTARVLEGD